MAPIYRHEPGAFAPVSGIYILVGHYGEATNFSVWRDKGERLPADIEVADNIGPCWWVEVSEANEQARVA
jgi:hypothetical protein